MLVARGMGARFTDLLVAISYQFRMRAAAVYPNVAR